MLFLLSPAKSLDYDTPTDVPSTAPAFVDEAAALIEQLRPCTPAQIATLMALSDKLAVLNVAPLFAAAIERIHSGQSVGALFE